MEKKKENEIKYTQIVAESYITCRILKHELARIIAKVDNTSTEKALMDIQAQIDAKIQSLSDRFHLLDQ